MYRRILVPVQGSPQDAQAIKLATAIAGRVGRAELTLVYVLEVPQELSLDADLPREIEIGERVLRAAAESARSSDGKWQRVTTELLQARSAAAAVVDEAIERSADAVVLATSNRRQRGVLTQGETLPYILDYAPCDVVVVRAVSEDGSLR